MEYNKIRDEFSWKRPKKFNFAGDVLDELAKKHSKSTALYWVAKDGKKREISFLEMSLASKRAANVLTDAGLTRGDLVILIVGKIPVWWEIFSACIRMGLVVSPAPTSITTRDLEYRIEMSGAAAVITEAALAEVLNDANGIRETKALFSVGGTLTGWQEFDAAMAIASDDYGYADTDGDEDSICYFTSGTTGHPKMTIHSHSSYGLGHEITGKYWLALNSGDLNWSMSDTGWAKAAYGCYFAPWLRGAAIFMSEAPQFDAVETIKLLQNHPISTFCAPPTVYRMLVQLGLNDVNFPNLKHCVSAGEPLNPEVLNVWKKATGYDIREGYGQTETVILCATLPGMECRPGSMGRPAPGFDVQIIDDRGLVQKPGIEGQIAVRVSPDRPLGLFKEYRADPERTKSVFLDEWYLTGDRGYRDPDGYFWFVSRADDVIISSGYRIGPFEVESALQEHSAVLESAVVSSPDEVRGEVVKAFIILAPGYSASTELIVEIQNYVKATTAPFKYPRQIEFVEQLPKTISGKIRRVELREREWGK